MDIINSIIGSLSQADILFIAAGLAVAIQYILNHYLNLGTNSKWLVSFPLPPLTAFIAFIGAYGHFDLQQGGLAYFVAQIIYYTAEKLKETGAKSVTVQNY